MNEIKLLLFDLGKVIIDLDEQLMLEYWQQYSDTIITEQMIADFYNSGANDSYERGEISDEQFFHKLSEFFPSRMTLTDFINGYNAMFIKVFDGMELLLSRLQKKYTLFMLSNTNNIHITFLQNKYASMFSQFHRIFFSHQLHMRKPEERIYTYVVSEAKVTPEQILFF